MTTIRSNSMIVQDSKAEQEKEILTQLALTAELVPDSAAIIRNFLHEKHAGQFEEPTAETRSQLLQSQLVDPARVRAQAKKINAGKWLELDFDDPQTIRQFYSARAELLITSDQLATALFLYNAKEMFLDDNGNFPIKQYRFDDANGPYDFTKISYANPTNIADFRNRLKKLAASEGFYFAINFSYVQVMRFFYSLLTDENVSSNQSMEKFLRAYIDRRAISEKEKNDFKALINNYKKNGSKLISFFFESDISLFKKMFVAKESKHGMDFLGRLIHLEEQHPSIEFSPDFDPLNPSSPLLCLILPTMSALNNLQLSMHGADAVMPLYTVGKVPVGLMRYADEGQNYLKPLQKRPVELRYPGVIGDNHPHDFSVKEFIVMYHDAVFHLWRAGCSPAKSFARFLRGVLDQKAYYLSKSIWRITDMDYSFSRAIRNEKNGEMKLNYLSVFNYQLIEGSGINFGKETEKHDQNLLLIVDMIKNMETLQRLVKMPIGNILLIGGGCNVTLIEVHDKIKKLIVEEKDFQKKSSTYYVLKYRLRHLSDGKALCEKLLKTDILAWYRNSGLYIKEAYTTSGKKISLQSLNESKISTEVNAALAKYDELNNIEVTFTSPVVNSLMDGLIEVTDANTTPAPTIKKLSPQKYSFSLFWLEQAAKNNRAGVKEFFDGIKKGAGVEIEPLYTRLKL